jgi:gamma-D-glutamyl-L-lysine dipeptidyl-peptidase
MQKITCALTYIPIRKEPSHRSEQISQLIFGEVAAIIKTENDWHFIQTEFDNYQGWIEKKVCIPHKKEAYEIVLNKSMLMLIEFEGNLMIPVGAKLQFSENKLLTIRGKQFDIILNDLEKDPDLIEIIHEFIGTPYLWGGRTLYGTDCSGFSQIVMKCMGIDLPRDASEQAVVGKKVESLKNVRQGDLAFFENEEGKIVHVGIILKDGLIVHASGSVRIDTFDKTGIYDETQKTYSHKLSVIKTFRS